MLLGAFWAALDGDVRARLRANGVERAVEQVLIDRWTGARAAWFPVEVPPAELGAFLAVRVPPGVASVETFDGLAIEDLYLSCACARGDVQALALLERHQFPAVRAALLRMRLAPEVIDELQQRLREQLFVSSGDGPTRIVEYRGRGALASWLSVSAVRAAYKLLERERREVPDEDERLARLSVSERDVETRYLKPHYRAAFKNAFGAAMGQLPDRDKNLLRQHYLDGLTLEQLAVLYRTHRATAARWLSSARQALLDRTRACLVEQLRVPFADCDSIIRMAQSQLDVTLHRLFAASA